MNAGLIATSDHISALAPPTLMRNLDALRARQPEIAEIIEHCELPAGLTPALGRDGTTTVMLEGPNGLQWLGGCSMPQAAAEEMFGQADPHGGSVTLPGILTGMEASLLARRLAPRFAVFVVDQPASFKIVFSLRDYGSLLEAGRLVVFLDDDLPVRARQFFDTNPGFTLPTHLFKVPQVPAGRLANLVRTLEDAGAAATLVQQQVVTDCVERIRESTLPAASDKVSIALLSADASPACGELIRKLEGAIQKMSLTHETCMPTQADRCHVAARILSVAKSKPDVIIYPHGLTGQERSLFPPFLSVVQWIQPGAPIQLSAGFGTCDIVVTETKTDAEIAISHGWLAANVVLAEPAAGDLPDRPNDAASINAQSPVAVMMDLPDDRPEAAGVTLPSHLALWQALRDEVLRRGDYDADSEAASILTAAQKASGTILTDETLAASFETCLRTRIAPATVARSLALALIRNGFDPQIWGLNWPKLGKKADLRQGPIPRTPEEAPKPTWLVIPWFSHAGIKLAMNALAQQCPVLMRGRAEAFASEYPALADLAGAIDWFESGSQLIAVLRRLRSRLEPASEHTRITARKVRAEHSMTNRLTILFERIRKLQSQSAAKGKS